MNRIDQDGDPWVAQWTDPDRTTHKLYEADVDLLRKVAAGAVEVHDTHPKWVYVDGSRCTTRDPETKVFRRLVDIGVIVPGRPERVEPRRPNLSSSGVGFERTRYGLADDAVETMLAAVR